MASMYMYGAWRERGGCVEGPAVARDDAAVPYDLVRD
jgi:hypothetical protein